MSARSSGFKLGLHCVLSEDCGSVNTTTLTKEWRGDQSPLSWARIRCGLKKNVILRNEWHLNSAWFRDMFGILKKKTDIVRYVCITVRKAVIPSSDVCKLDKMSQIRHRNSSVNARRCGHRCGHQIRLLDAIRCKHLRIGLTPEEGENVFQP